MDTTRKHVHTHRHIHPGTRTCEATRARICTRRERARNPGKAAPVTLSVCPSVASATARGEKMKIEYHKQNAVLSQSHTQTRSQGCAQTQMTSIFASANRWTDGTVGEDGNRHSAWKCSGSKGHKDEIMTALYYCLSKIQSFESQFYDFRCRSLCVCAALCSYLLQKCLIRDCFKLLPVLNVDILAVKLDWFLLLDYKQHYLQIACFGRKTTVCLSVCQMSGKGSGEVQLQDGSAKNQG